MGEILHRYKDLIYDYTTYKTDILLLGERRYFNAILTGQQNACSFLGDGLKAVSALPFLEELRIVTSANVDLTLLRIEGNQIQIFNSHTSTITVDIGTPSVAQYLTIQSNYIIKLKFDGSSWVIQKTYAIEFENGGIIAVDYEGGMRFELDGETFGHFVGTISGDDTLYIDNRGTDSTLFRVFQSPSWVEAMEIENSGDIKIFKSLSFAGVLTVDSDSDSVDVTGIRRIEVDASLGNVTIGGLANGVNDQEIYITKRIVTNTLTIEHNEATGTQKMFFPGFADIVIPNYGGIWLYCYNNAWFGITY